MKRYISAAIRPISEEPDDVRQSLAQSDRLGVYDLTTLSEDSDLTVVGFVAANPKTPHDILYKLATGNNVWLRTRLCSNPNLPEDVALVLADDPDERVRENLAKHPNLPVSVISKLASDSDERVLTALALNSNTPDYIRNQVSAAIKSYIIYISLYGVPAGDEPLSNRELQFRKDSICNNATVLKYGMQDCSIENQFINRDEAGGDTYIGYQLYITFSLMSEDEADLVSDTIESIVESFGDFVDDCYWDTGWN